MKKLFFISALILLIASCKENKIPAANAGNDQSIVEGATVTLDASASSDPDDDFLTYWWTAPSGIVLSSATDARPTFTAPEVSVDASYTFTLVVNDGESNSSADTVIITNANQDKFLQFITAGQTEGLGIKYVDFEPDAQLVIDWDHRVSVLNFDLDNDSIDDFVLKYEFWDVRSQRYSYWLGITPLGTNTVCVSKINKALVQSLVYGDTIGSTNNWSNSMAFLYSNSSYTFTDPSGVNITQASHGGDWYDHDNIYLGVKVIKDNKELFGWIDVKMKGTGVRGFAISLPY